MYNFPAEMILKSLPRAPFFKYLTPTKCKLHCKTATSPEFIDGRCYDKGACVRLDYRQNGVIVRILTDIKCLANVQGQIK